SCLTHPFRFVLCFALSPSPFCPLCYLISLLLSHIPPLFPYTTLFRSLLILSRPFLTQESRYISYVSYDCLHAGFLLLYSLCCKGGGFFTLHVCSYFKVKIILFLM